MHDGLKGRKHVYSYVHHDDAWWKVVGHTADKVFSLGHGASAEIITSPPSIGDTGDRLQRQRRDASRSWAFPPYLQSFTARTVCK